MPEGWGDYTVEFHVHANKNELVLCAVLSISFVLNDGEYSNYFRDIMVEDSGLHTLFNVKCQVP